MAQKTFNTSYGKVTVHGSMLENNKHSISNGIVISSDDNKFESIEMSEYPDNISRMDTGEVETLIKLYYE